jgi:hypothetical protein
VFALQHASISRVTVRLSMRCAAKTEIAHKT